MITSESYKEISQNKKDFDEMLEIGANFGNGSAAYTQLRILSTNVTTLPLKGVYAHTHKTEWESPAPSTHCCNATPLPFKDVWTRVRPTRRPICVKTESRIFVNIGPAAHKRFYFCISDATREPQCDILSVRTSGNIHSNVCPIRKRDYSAVERCAKPQKLFIQKLFIC